MRWTCGRGREGGHDSDVMMKGSAHQKIGGDVNCQMPFGQFSGFVYGCLLMSVIQFHP